MRGGGGVRLGRARSPKPNSSLAASVEAVLPSYSGTFKLRTSIKQRSLSGSVGCGRSSASPAGRVCCELRVELCSRRARADPALRRKHLPLQLIPLPLVGWCPDLLMVSPQPVQDSQGTLPAQVESPVLLFSPSFL